MNKGLSGPAAAGAGVASGILLFLAFPPVDLGVLAFFALIPLALAFRTGSPSKVMLSGWAFGVTFFGCLIYWIQLFGPEAYAALVALQAFWFAVVLGVSRRLLGVGERGGLLAFSAAFLIAEYVRSHFPFGGFGWGGLGYSQHDNIIFLRLAALTGIWGLSFGTLIVNCILIKAFDLRRSFGALAISGLSGVLILFGPALAQLPAPDGSEVKLALVQGNAPEALYSPGAEPQADDTLVFENHAEATQRLTGVYDLVVWPESSLDTDPSADPYFGPRLNRIIKEEGSHFLVGAPVDLPDAKFRNSSFFFAPDGELLGYYDKRQLVPFGEYIPARRFFVGVFGAVIEELQRIPRDGVPGTTPTIFDLPQGQFASVICFESTSPGLVRSFVSEGARLIVVSTNNISFQRTAASAQHVAFSQVRAAEHRMWIGHAALTGISALVDPEGRVLETTELFEQEVLTADVQFATSLTIYGRLGDWFPLLVILLTLASTIFRWRERKESKSKVRFTTQDPVRPLVILPTYNERENIETVLAAVRQALPAGEILVVDDGSPDGTAELVRNHADMDEKVHLLERPSKGGLGKAYVAGFRWGLERGFNRFVEMDSDLSHDPKELPVLVGESEAGLAVGSRYVRGGGVEGWSRFRHLLSRAGNLYARIALGTTVRDSTSGFRCYRREVLEAIGLDDVVSEGYAFQIDMTYRTELLGVKPVEIPIVFRERQAGRSKMSKAIVFEAILLVTLWAVRDLFRGRRLR